MAPHGATRSPISPGSSSAPLWHTRLSLLFDERTCFVVSHTQSNGPSVAVSAAAALAKTISSLPSRPSLRSKADPNREPGGVAPNGSHVPTYRRDSGVQLRLA